MNKRTMRGDDWPADSGRSGTGPVPHYKLRPPPLPSHRVERRQLLQLLDGAMTGHVTVVAAPAGYGKTALLTEWAKRQAGRVAWLSIEPGDDDPAQLLTGIGRALKVPLPEQVIPSGVSRSPEGGSLELVPLLSTLAEYGPATLILDDAHWLAERATVNTLSFLVSHLPGNLHFVFSGREPPALPLARMRAAGLVTQLGIRQLRFSCAETGVLLNQRFDLGLPDETVELIWEQTEGWCAGLRLAALALSEQYEGENGLIHGLNAASAEIGTYLLEEVFERQQPWMQQFLLDTCVADRLCPDLCRVLSTRGDGAEVLDDLVKRGLFTSVIDPRDHWYRYHRLFADFLRRQLQLRDPDRRRKMNRLASSWFEAAGSRAEAVEHALEGEDFEAAARMIACAAPDMVLRGARQRLLRWIDRLPATRIRPRRWLAIARAWALLLEGEFDSVPGAIMDAVRLIRHRARNGAGPPETARLLGHAAAVAALRAAWQGDSGAVARHARRAMRRLPTADALTRATLAVSMALHLPRDQRTECDLETASVALLRGARASRERGLIEPALAVLFLRADLEMATGRLRDAERTYREAWRLAADRDARPTLIAGIGYAGYANLLYEHDKLLDAERHANYCVEESRQRQDLATLCQAKVILARIAAARGDAETAQAYLSKADDVACRAEVAWLKTQIEVWWVRISLRQGRLSRALRQCRSPEARIRVQLARSRTREALELINELQVQLAGSPLAGLHLEVDLLRAMALYQKGDQREMLESLEQALELGRLEGHWRSFLDEGEPIRPLLQEAIRSGIAPEYAHCLEREIKRETAKTREGGLVSGREQEIIELVGLGLSNKEIADRLGIAYGTVKRHLHNVFTKLHVRTRTELMARLRQVG